MAWRINPFDFESELITDEVAAFIKWAQTYQTRCKTEGWIDSSARIDLVIDKINKAELALANPIELVAFDEITPQLKALLDCIEKSGITVHRRSLLAPKKGSVNTLAALDERTELLSAAHQAKAWLAQNPKSSIAIVIPDLERRRQSVERAFLETLSLGQFNISAPLSLLSYPFINAALLGLGLVKAQVPLETLSIWLRSPFFIGGMSESHRRASFDIFLREQGEPSFSWPHLIVLLTRFNELSSASHDDSTLKPFCVPLENFAELGTTLSLKSKKTSQDWCDLIHQLLECLGWPGERTADSQEFQLKMRWDALIKEYSQLGRVLGKHTFSECLFRIRSLAQSLSFLPQSHHPQVHILGMLEAAGLPFDYVWVLGLHREAWPVEPSPNPFIPLSLQRRLELPRSSAKRELKVAKRLTDTLSRGAPEVIFSYSRIVEEERREKSTLLNEFPILEAETLCLTQLQSQLSRIGIIQPSEHDLSLATQAPALLENERVKQGTRSIQLQAACPFRAFAEVRLGAKPILKNKLGLGPEIRGEILHQVLMQFWEGLGDQAALLALSETDLHERLTRVLDHTLSDWQKRRPSTLTPRFVALEHKRLFQLLLRFIELEKSRSAFTIVEREQRHSVYLAGFHLSVRIDRVDQLSTGEEIVLDYKTGLSTIGHWFGERPKDPQLPLYCVTRSPKPQGIAFATLRPEGPKFQGVSETEQLLPGIKSVASLTRLGTESTWDAQCMVWDSTILQLAKDFSEGLAKVDPAEGLTTCRTCALQSLCRIHVQDRSSSFV
jgi:probable DNA repair protein